MKKITFREIFAQFINPTILGTDIVKFPYILMPLLPTVCYLLFALQLMLDKMKITQGSPNIAGLPVVGLLLGIASGFVIPAIFLAMARLTKDTTAYKDILIYSCISFSGCLIFEVIGMCFNLFLLVQTSSTFGILGFAWIMIPFMAISKYISENRSTLAVITITLAGAVSMLIWGALYVVADKI